MTETLTRRQRLTSDQIEQALVWRERGWSCSAIAKRFGVSAGAINYQCLKAGVHSPRQHREMSYDAPATMVGRDGIIRRRFTPADDRQLVQLSQNGESAYQIAKALGRPYTSTRMRLLLLGLREEMAA